MTPVPTLISLTMLTMMFSAVAAAPPPVPTLTPSTLVAIAPLS